MNNNSREYVLNEALRQYDFGEIKLLRASDTWIRGGLAPIYYKVLTLQAGDVIYNEDFVVSFKTNDCNEIFLISVKQYDEEDDCDEDLIY